MKERQVNKTVRSIFFAILVFSAGILLYHQLLIDYLESTKKDTQEQSNEVPAEAYPDELSSFGDTSDERIFKENANLQSSRENALTRAVARVSPAVVSVNVTKVKEFYQYDPFGASRFNFFKNFNRTYRKSVHSSGSGFMISPDGYIVTNDHVILNAVEIVVATQDGKEYTAQVIGTDRLSDIALLKINSNDAPYLRFGNSDKIVIGEWVFASGNPFGLFVRTAPTVTVGVVSAVKRNFSPYEGRVYQNMIQTDAAINNGNSGGPLCNILGEVIGMNTFIFTGEAGSGGNVGIGFAIPAKRIKQITNDLRQYNGIDRDIWIGMYVSNMTQYLAKQLRYSSPSGVFVTHIDRNSPAEDADIRIRDIVTKINGKVVNHFQAAKEAVLTSDLKVGDILTIEIWRNGRLYEKKLRLGKRSSS